MNSPRRFKLIVCDIMLREACYCIARSNNIIDPLFMGKGLHNLGDCKMRRILQEEIEKVEKNRYDAILLGYGLCNNGIISLHASLPLVVPRAHDCITLLLGSKEKYRDYFDRNPGTYYQSPGWLERDVAEYKDETTVTQQLGLRSYQDYVAEYGEENAKYIMETLGGGLQYYTKLAYIDTGIGDFPDYEQRSQEQAAQNGWAYEKLEGSCELLQRLLDGQWDSREFAVIYPGHAVQPTHNEEIITSADMASPGKADKLRT